MCAVSNSSESLSVAPFSCRKPQPIRASCGSGGLWGRFDGTARITLAHFSALFRMSLPKLVGERANAAAVATASDNQAHRPRRISLRACDVRYMQIFMQFIDLYFDNG